MSTRNLLVELFVEELPPKALKKLGDAFGRNVFEGLQDRDFLESASTSTTYASPRRLAVHITNVRATSVPRPRPPTKLMPATVGLDKDNKPTPQLVKRLTEKLGYDLSAIDFVMRERVFAVEEGGKSILMHREDLAAGAALHIGLEGALAEALVRLPIPKVMTYQLADGWTDVKFVRPAHALVVLHGADVVPVQALGLQAGRVTHGHRFEARAQDVSIPDADSYAATLREQGAVIASFAERRAEIQKQLAAAAQAAGGGARPIEDDDLLDEVTALVERPNVLTCAFDKEFLEVPQECLILTMKANQKYFPLLDAQGKLTNRFLVVSNIRPQDPSAVIGGNERVVRPRLADAKFFFDQDRKKTLASRVPGLAKVVYHNKLGTQGERIERVRALAKVIGAQMGSDHLAHEADVAANLAKADLLTDMVGEFPELQGIMGGYYARHDGLGEDIAIAIEDHYRPRFAGDELPRNDLGIAVALADKLETLAGLFAIGQLPTGDKDPFALRRHALGVVRMLMERKLPLALNELVAEALGLFPQAGPETTSQLADFIDDRLAGLLREQGYSAQEVDAVLALKPQKLGDVAQRLAAVKSFAVLSEAPALASANKRIGNILRKSETAPAETIEDALLKEPAERKFLSALQVAAAKANPAYEGGRYTESLLAWAQLKEPVDAFFDDVMVNAEDMAVRRNRLALLSALHHQMNKVADLSRLVVEK